MCTMSSQKIMVRFSKFRIGPPLMLCNPPQKIMVEILNFDIGPPLKKHLLIAQEVRTLTLNKKERKRQWSY